MGFRNIFITAIAATIVICNAAIIPYNDATYCDGTYYNTNSNEPGYYSRQLNYAGCNINSQTNYDKQLNYADDNINSQTNYNRNSDEGNQYYNDNLNIPQYQH